MQISKSFGGNFYIGVLGAFWADFGFHGNLTILGNKSSNSISFFVTYTCENSCKRYLIKYSSSVQGCKMFSMVFLTILGDLGVFGCFLGAFS